MASSRRFSAGREKHAIGVGQIQGHLPGAAPDLDDPGIGGNGVVEQLRKTASLGAGTKCRQRIVRRIARKRRLVIETPDDLSTRLGRHGSEDRVDERRERLDGGGEDQDHSEHAEKHGEGDHPAFAGLAAPQSPHQIGNGAARAGDHD